MSSWGLSQKGSNYHIIAEKSAGSHLQGTINLRKDYSIIRHKISTGLFFWKISFYTEVSPTDVSQQVHADIHSVHSIEVGYAGDISFLTTKAICTTSKINCPTKVKNDLQNWIGKYFHFRFNF